MAKIDLLATGKTLVHEVGDDDVGGLAAQLAYHFLLALFPFFIFLTALGGFAAAQVQMGNPAQSIVDLLGANLPDDVAGVLTDQLQQVIDSSNPGLLSFGIVGALWAASGGMKSIMKAMNRAYDVPESRSFLKKNLVALGLTLLFSAFAIIAFVLLVVGELVAQEVASVVGLPSIAVDISRWVLAFVLMALGTAVLYWAAPNIDIPFKWVTPGSVLATVGWLLATAAFAFYVTTFGSYNATYGALGGIVVLLIWFFISGFILVLGAELNAIVDQQTDPEMVESKRQQKRAEAGQKKDERPQASGHAQSASDAGGSAGAGRTTALPAEAAPRATPGRPARSSHEERQGFGGKLVGLLGVGAAALLLRKDSHDDRQ